MNPIRDPFPGAVIFRSRFKWQGFYSSVSIIFKGGCREGVCLNYFSTVELALHGHSPAFIPGSLVMSGMATDTVTLTGPESRSNP